MNRKFSAILKGAFYGLVAAVIADSMFWEKGTAKASLVQEAVKSAGVTAQ